MTTAGKPITCQAAVLWKVGEDYSIEKVVVDVPKKSEVRIKMTSTGCCHSDLYEQEGFNDSLYLPALLGHEGAGFIESVGEGVIRFEPGDLVVLTFESYCGECDLCIRQETNVCRKTRRDGFQMDGTSRVTVRGKALSQLSSLGTFSEYTVTSEFNVTKVNSKAKPSTLCLVGCCIPTGYGAVMNVGKVTPGSTVAVWGLGGVGMCVLMGCRDSGASRIIGIDTNPKKFELARKFGATDCLNPREVSSVKEALVKITKDGPDVCFVSVGAEVAMEEAFSSCHPYWGKTVIIGLNNSSMRINVWDLLFGKQLLGTRYGSYKAVRDIPMLVDKVINGQIQLEELVSHRFPLSKINEGFKMLKTGDSLRTIIDFSLNS